MRPLEVTVNDKMQRNFTYALVEKEGFNFRDDFKPELTPKEMLHLGVFGGKYMTDCAKEFPKGWYESALLSPKFSNPEINYFGVNASMPLAEWQKRGWIYPDDPRGWFQWYCRYFMGRRIEEEDDRQIKRWKQMKRHIGQIKKNCHVRDMTCRRKQRQALLHWAYDSRKF